MKTQELINDLLLAVKENTQDDNLKLVLADALEEDGQIEKSLAWRYLVKHKKKPSPMLFDGKGIFWLAENTYCTYRENLNKSEQKTCTISQTFFAHFFNSYHLGAFVFSTKWQAYKAFIIAFCKAYRDIHN